MIGRLARPGPVTSRTSCGRTSPPANARRARHRGLDATATRGEQTDGPDVPRRDGGGLRARRAVADPRLADGRNHGDPGCARPARPLDGQPPRPDRGRHRHRQDQDPPAHGGPALGGRRAGARGRHQGRPDRPRPPRRRGEREGPGAREGSRLGLQAGWPPHRAPVAHRQARGAGPGHRALVRAAAPGQGPGPQRDPDERARARVQVLRRPRPRPPRSRRPAHHPQVPRLGRGEGRPGGLRRDRPGDAGRHPPLDRRPRAAGRRRLLRRARVRGRGPHADDARGAGDHQRPRAVGRDGQAGPVQHVHALDAGPALRGPPRGRRPAEAEARLLLRRGPPSLRRREQGAPRPGRAHRPAHQVEGRGRLLRDPGADRRALIGPRPARQPCSARPARLHAGGRRQPQEDRPNLPDDRLLRRRADDHVAGHGRGARHRALPPGRADAAGADAPRAAGLAHGRDPARRDGAADQRRFPLLHVRRADRPGECPRDPLGAPGGREGGHRRRNGSPRHPRHDARRRNDEPSRLAPASWSESAATRSARRRPRIASASARTQPIDGRPNGRRSARRT